MENHIKCKLTHDKKIYGNNFLDVKFKRKLIDINLYCKEVTIDGHIGLQIAGKFISYTLSDYRSIASTSFVFFLF